MAAGWCKIPIMHRQPLLSLLERYERHFADEADVVSRIRKLVSERPDCFVRSCRPGHVTASAWIVSPGGHQCLLTHHRLLEIWVQLGGHADGQCDVLQAALREAREESGIQHFEPRTIDGSCSGAEPVLPLDVDIHTIPARYDHDGTLVEDEHEHHDIRFMLVADPNATLRVSSESHDVRWIASSELRRFTEEESVLRMLRKATAYWRRRECDSQ